MEVRLLGPLEAADAGAPLALGGIKPRALLAALTLAGGRVLTSARLVEDLWGERPPETAPKMVQIHVSALRKVLPAGVLVTRAPGYAIDLPREAVDAFRAEDALRAGRAALAAGDARAAAEALGAALALWRGPALAEFDEPFAEGERRRLEELRIALTEERLAADLALGGHADAVREVEGLIGEHPLRERLRELQIVALYRSGRQAEALAAYQGARRTLSEELGIEPSARLRDLERAVLRQDPDLDAPAAAAAPGTRADGGPAPIGRDAELAALGDALTIAAAGATRIVLVTGEAGAGKTTLVQTFLDGLAEAAARVGRGQCVDQHGPSEAYMPVLQALERLCAGPGGSDALALLADRAPTWLVQMPWLLEPSAREDLGRRLIGANRDRMLREGVEALTRLSRARPVVVAIEDLQWSDLATLDLLGALARHHEPARLLVVATLRPPEGPGGEGPVHAAARDLVARGLAGEIALRAFGAVETTGYLAARLPGAEVTPELAAALAARTGGSPLFLEKTVDDWIADGRALAEEGRWRLAAPDEELSRGIPSTLRGLIRRRLDPLAPDDRRLLEAASVAAPAFSAALVAAVTGGAEGETEERLDALARAGVMLAAAGEERWPDGTVAGRYRFAHDLEHEVLYDDLPAGRRARAHLAIGDRLERGHPEGADALAAELAVHFLRGGEPARAVRHLATAAERAARRLAPREALALAEAARAGLAEVPAAERAPLELRIARLHGLAVIATSGWSAPAAQESLERALALARELGQPQEIAWATFRLATLHEVRGAYDRSDALMGPLMAAKERPHDRRLALDLHELEACTLFHQGRFEGSLESAERGLALERADVDEFLAAAGDDPVTACHSWAALSAWHLGRPEEAREVSQRAIALVEGPRRRHAAAAALALGAIVAQFLQDPARARELAEGAIEEAELRGYVYRAAMGQVLRGWARTALGELAEGLADLQDGIARSRATGARMDEAYYLGLLADARLRAGDPAAARAALDEAREVVPRDGRFFHEPELHRLRGEVARQEGDLEAAERELRAARAIARDQGALLPELRAALALGTLLRATGRPTEARAGVAEALGRFTEGFDAPDLRAAADFLADAGPADAPGPPVRYARSGELAIAYEVTGEGPPDLVLVPGFISHLEQDRREPRHVRFLDGLAGLGRLIRFDKRGTGLSDRPADLPDLEARMDDVRAVMDAAGSGRAILVGYSEGCPMCALFAATYPERVAGVVLIGGFAKRMDPDDDYPWAPTREERAAHIEAVAGEGGLERMMRLMCPSADEAMTRWWGERCRAAASPGAIRALGEMNSRIDVRAVLPAVQAPALVVHRTGDADVRVEEGRYLAARIPGATMVELPGENHFVAIGADEIFAAIAPFVAALAARPAEPAPEEAVATVVVAADGDAPLVQVYDGPARAIREAVRLAERLGRGVGVHTGPVRRAGRPDGDAVRVATAVAGRASPGEALVTITSRDLVPGSGLGFDGRGELADADGARSLYAARAPGAG